jgi:hypothetical protein
MAITIFVCGNEVILNLGLDEPEVEPAYSSEDREVPIEESIKDSPTIHGKV